MPRSTRGNPLDEAPARALRSGSLGTGARTNEGPGSRASARASRRGDAQGNPAGAVAGQEGNPEDAADLETMRDEQADIRLSGRIAGYKNDAKLTRRENEFHDLLVKDLKLSHDTADEIFRQGIDGFHVTESLSANDFSSIVVSMHKSKSSYCVSFFLNTLFQRNMSLIRK